MNTDDEETHTPAEFYSAFAKSLETAYRALLSMFVVP